MSKDLGDPVSDDSGAARGNGKGLPLSTAPELCELFTRLLDRGHMLEVLRRVLPPLTDVAIRIEDCRAKARFHRDYVRENRLRVTYTLEVTVDGAAPREVSLIGIAPVGSEFIDAPTRARARALRDHPMVAPFRELTSYVADLRLALLLFPLDADLPGLADITGQDGARLLANCLPEPWHSARLEPLRCEVRHYTPADRAVVRVTTRRADEPAPERSFYVKVFDDDRGAANHRQLSSVWSAAQTSRSLRVPEPLGYGREHHLLVMSEAPGDRDLNEWIKRIEKGRKLPDGVDCARLDRCLDVVVAALRELQQCAARPASTRTFRDELAQLDEDRELLAHLRQSRPGLVTRAEALLDRLQALAPAAEGYVPAHGAFRHKQMIGDEHHLTIIDWDGFCLASPALDPATFLGRLRREHLLHPGQAPGLEQVATAFRCRFLAHRPDLAGQLALYEALVLTEQMLRCFRRAGDDEETADHIRCFADSAEQLLERAQGPGATAA